MNHCEHVAMYYWHRYLNYICNSDKRQLYAFTYAAYKDMADDHPVKFT